MTAQPLEFVIDTSARVAVLRWPDIEPELTPFRVGFHQLLADTRFLPTFGIVSDRRQLTTPPSRQFVEGFVELVASAARTGRFTGRWATVVSPSQPAVFGMGRMTEFKAEFALVPYRVFRDLDEAIEWASGASSL